MDCVQKTRQCHTFAGFSFALLPQSIYYFSVINLLSGELWVINVEDHDAHCRLAREIIINTTCRGLYGTRKCKNTSPRMIYQLFSMVLAFFDLVCRGWSRFPIFFVVVAEECCGLGFGGQENLIPLRGVYVLFCFSAAERRLCSMHPLIITFCGLYGSSRYHTSRRTCTTV